MLRKTAALAVLACLCLWVPQKALADPVYGFMGSRTTPASSGVIATDGWGDTTEGQAEALGFRISWVIIAPRPTESLWTYRYTISNKDGGALSKDLSHWLLEVSDATSITLPDETVVWGSDYTATSDGNSNPDLPGTLYGIKFESTYVTFTSEQAPVWGDFYASDGTDKLDGEHVPVTAWNSGIGTEPTDLTHDFTPWILRPDSDGFPPGPPQIIPEPGLSVLALGAFLAGVFARRRKGKHDEDVA